MISSYDIESLQSKLKEDEIIKVCFTNDVTLLIDTQDTICHHLVPYGQEEDDSVLIIRRENGRKVMMNLNRVDYICTTLKRYL